MIYLGIAAFRDCSSLKSVIIPYSVTNIWQFAFDYCMSLETVYYTGTMEQWDSISIDICNHYLSNANVVYNYVPEE